MMKKCKKTGKREVREVTAQDLREKIEKTETILSGVVMHPFATPFSANMMPSRQESHCSLQKIKYPSKKQNSGLEFLKIKKKIKKSELQNLKRS